MLLKEIAMKTSWSAVLAGSLLLQPLAFADVSYQETTRVTGGSMMGMVKMAGAFSSQAKQALAPTTSTVMIHGGRMVRSDPHATEIINLDDQTITMIDHDKRTYSVMTFQEMQQAMANAAAKAKGAKPSNTTGSQMSFDAHISNNGATRQLDGQTASETLLTITMTPNTGDANAKGGMAATSEMWLIKDAPGMAELRSFNERMAKELSIDMARSSMNTLLAAQPGGAQAMEELRKESGKVSGLPVLQVTRVGMTLDGQPLAAPSVAPLPQSQGQGQGSTAGDVGKEVATGTATQEAGSQLSRLGTFGRALGGSSMGALMHHTSSNSAPSQPANADPATAGVMLESQTETTGFSVAPVDTSSFQIPTGYKAVASPLEQK
jgi:hypothetical protein